jgi:hypothetical protein
MSDEYGDILTPEEEKIYNEYRTRGCLALGAEIASLRSRLAEAEKVIDGIACACICNTGYPFVQISDAKSFADAYRAKYPISSETK